MTDGKEEKGEDLIEESSTKINEDFIKMSDKHWKDNDPEFYEMMMKHRKKHGVNKDPA